MHLDMRPNRAGNNLFDSGFAYAIYVGKLLTLGACCQFSNTKNVLFGKLRGRIRLTSRAMALPVAILGNHVVNVILACAKEQVRRIGASRIVTMVQHPKLGGYGADVEFVREAMRSCIALFATKTPIAKVIDRSSPYPASAVQNRMDSSMLIDFCPKALLNRRASRRSACMPTNEAFWLSFNPTEFRVVSRRNRCGLTAATFAKFGRILMSSHVGDYITNNLSECLQKKVNLKGATQ